jgi:hypothetical protein
MISGNALANSEYDKCIKEEKDLKMQEAIECSGLRYLLNPSGCFATRKTLKDYSSGKCKKNGMIESVDFNSNKIVQENKIITNSSFDPKKAEIKVPQQVNMNDQLKEENARLKAEISRLKAENEQLRKATQSIPLVR